MACLVEARDRRFNLAHLRRRKLFADVSNGAGGQTCTILPQAMFFVDLVAWSPWKPLASSN